MSLDNIIESPPYLMENPNLYGGWAPVDKELVENKLQVIGELPRDLNGLYVRNGPVPQFSPADKYHWYDGDGMLQAVHFSQGRAVFRNRWVLTDGLLTERKAGRNLYP